jgi:AcrR family transcriptional regulator
LGTDTSAIRGNILEAAEDLIRVEGLSACTTRAIALRAGCSEGSIYRHFADKHALLTEIVHSRFPAFLETMRSLPGRAGTATVAGNLETVAGAALGFHRAVLPLVTGPMNDHELLAQQRRHFREANTGPMRMFADLTRYLADEQARGRVSATASAEHAARMLLGTCFAQAFVEAFVGEEARLGDDEAFVSGVVGTLMTGLDPAGGD